MRMRMGTRRSKGDVSSVGNIRNRDFSSSFY